MCRSDEAVVVGGGNSAGQAAVFLSGFAKTIWMLVRGPSLAERQCRGISSSGSRPRTISSFTSTPKSLRLAVPPNGWLDRVRWKNRTTEEETERRIRNLFLFIGHSPRPTRVGIAASPWTQKVLFRRVPMLHRASRARTIGRRSAAAARVERAWRLRRRRRAVGLRQASRRGDRGGSGGGGGAAFLFGGILYSGASSNRFIPTS